VAASICSDYRNSSPLISSIPHLLFPLSFLSFLLHLSTPHLTSLQPIISPHIPTHISSHPHPTSPHPHPYYQYSFSRSSPTVIATATATATGSQSPTRATTVTTAVTVTADTPTPSAASKGSSKAKGKGAGSVCGPAVDPHLSPSGTVLYDMEPYVTKRNREELSTYSVV
jgi:hypothetical protein